MPAVERTGPRRKATTRKLSASSARVSLPAYAKRRGQSRTAIQRAIREGRLTQRSVGQDARGRWLIDPILADREWEAHTRPKVTAEKTRPVGKPSGLALATQRERESRAKLAELEYQKKSASLVRASEVEHRWSAIVVGVRTSLLGLPTRTKQRLPHLTVADLAVLDDLIRETLEELADRGTGSSNGDAR